MLTVTKLARTAGLSRTTILYYDRIGLLQPVARSEAGYRLYDADSVQRLRMIRTYRDTGIGLKEIRDLLSDRDGTEMGVLRTRLTELDREISNLRNQQRAIVGLLKKIDDSQPNAVIGPETWVQVLAASGMDAEDIRRWHAEFERNAPEAHQSFLRWLGMTEDQLNKIREGSRIAQTA